jgi:FkbM family methyltransferase
VQPHKQAHTVVRAFHPHWRGELILSNTDNTIQHKYHLSRGIYKISDDWLTVVWEEYGPEIFHDSPHLPQDATAIVDLGANIGLATMFFAIKYPDARILAVEPEEDNYDMLVGNTSGLGSRLKAVNAAAWTHDGIINLQTEDIHGKHLEAWAYQVTSDVGRSKRAVRCSTLKTLLDNAGLDTVDILKIDIEGSELELFSENTEGWINRAEFIMVETHDRFRPGTDSAVRRALQPKFQELPRSAEHLLFKRAT